MSDSGFVLPPRLAPERDEATGRFRPSGRAVSSHSTRAARPTVAADSYRAPGGRRRFLRVASVLLACYLSGLLAVNLTSNPLFAQSLLGKAGTAVFPRITGQSSGLDTASINYEWDTIEANYVYRDVDSTAATQAAEAGIVAELQTKFHDIHMEFRPAAVNTVDQQDLNNERTGSIGIEVGAFCSGGVACASGVSPTEVVISNVLVNQPADVAGVHRGDVLLAVDSTKISSLGALNSSAFDTITSLVRGDPNTKVKLTVQRGDQQLTLVATRENLTIPSAYAQRMGSILYLQLVGFESDTGDLVKQLLSQNLPGITGIVLDLRENGGGYVTAAQDVVSQFVAPSSSRVNVDVRRGRMAPSGDPSTAETVETDPLLGGGLATTTPKLVVLVNGDTASAAEITTAALRDYHRATIVGSITYGKGTVQTDFTLPDGNDLHLTIEKWYGPDNENVDGSGIKPDIVVALADPDNRFRLDAQSPPITDDPQAEAALHALGG